MNQNNEHDTLTYQRRKVEWRKKGWTIPEIRGSKTDWFKIVKSLIILVSENKANNLDFIPNIPEIDQMFAWRRYAPFLKGMGLASNRSGILYLTNDGLNLLNNLTQIQLANIFYEKVKLFGEVLDLIAQTPLTIEEVNENIIKKYGLNWSNLSHIRKRMDWLEVLGMIEAIGNRKWKITSQGKEVLKNWELISPDILESQEIESTDIEILGPPLEIESLIKELFDNPKLHDKRSTYNIWVPSPNKIENLRIIIQSTLDKISKSELFNFISEEFNLKLSSVESMLPFLKAAGLIEEIGRSIYCATPAAKSWIETGNDLDFVRILHCHIRFVGEMIKESESDIIRNDLYTKAKMYGLNAEKARWIVGFLIEAGLLEELQYLHLKATPLGIKFASSLPLFVIEDSVGEKYNWENIKEEDGDDELERIVNRLDKTSKDPYAEGKQSGVAFEKAISEIFKYMGYEAKKVGGPGDTDVVVKWKNDEGNDVVAIIDCKSKSSGQVSHGDISDVAIDAHKEKNNADFVAIVGQSFSGDTIRNHALKKQFALVTVKQIIDATKASKDLGLSLQELSLIFQVPNGFLKLNELILLKQRELDIISNVLSRFYKEQKQIGALSPRDLFLLLRDTNVSPSLDELLSVFKMLSDKNIDVLKAIDKDRLPENTMYVLCETRKSVYRLRALATTIEKSMCN